MVWVIVVLMAAVLAVPAFAQNADLTLEFGSPEWLANAFGSDENFCTTVGQDPAVRAGWEAQFPELAAYCGWSE